MISKKKKKKRLQNTVNKQLLEKNAPLKSKKKSNGYKAPAIQKAFRLLNTIAKSPKNLGIAELAKRLGYSKSTTHGLVHALLREGALTQGPSGRKLFLGPTIAELLFSNWHQEKVKALAQPILNQIRDRINETVILGVRIRDRVLLIASAEASESLKISVPVGSTIPLVAGAVGKVFLSGETREMATRLIQEQGLPNYTPRSKTTFEKYLSELEQVRQQGYAVDIEEYLPGIRAVAVALNNRRGLPTAVWVVGISANMNTKKMTRIAEITITSAEKLRAEIDEYTQSTLE